MFPAGRGRLRLGERRLDLLPHHWVALALAGAAQGGAAADPAEGPRGVAADQRRVVLGEGALEQVGVPLVADVAEGDGEKIMHVSLPIGEGNVLMATDALDSMGQKLTVGNNFYISISAASKEEADALFTALSEGGTIEMPLQDTFWGAYFGMFADKFGIQWMVNFDYK